MKAFIYLNLVFMVLGCNQNEKSNSLVNDPNLERRVRSLATGHKLVPNYFSPNLTAMTNLGQKLFKDNQLSSSQDISCFTCHGDSSTEKYFFIHWNWRNWLCPSEISS